MRYHLHDLRYNMLDSFSNMAGCSVECGEHIVSEFGEQRVRLLVSTVIMMNFSILVDNEYAAEVDPHRSVAHGVCVAIAEPTVKGVVLIGEKIPDVFKGCNFEHLWLAIDYFSFEGSQEAVWGEYDRAVRHHKSIVLLDSLDVVSCQVCLANRPR